MGIDNLLLKYPSDFWVRLAYIDSKTGANPALGSIGILNKQADESIIARFRREYEIRPEDPEAAYLYAYALVHRDSEEAMEILSRLTQKNSSFPRAWLTLAKIHATSRFNDHAKMQKYSEKFMELCPNPLDPGITFLVTQLDKSDALTAYAKRLREQNAARGNDEVVPRYDVLWYLEKKLTTPEEWPEFRKRVEGDLEFLEGLDKIKYKNIIALGYEYISKEPKPVPTAFVLAQNEWQQANPRPPADAGPEALTAYYREQLHFLDQRLDKAPQDPDLISSWFTTLSSIPDTPDGMLIRGGNKVLAVFHNSFFSFDVLRVWAQRGLELDRIPGLIREISTALQKFYDSLPQSDLSATQPSLSIDDQRWWLDSTAWAILVTTYIKSHQINLARGILAEWSNALNARHKLTEELRIKIAARQPNAIASERINSSDIERNIVSEIPNDDSRYYNACAQLAAAENQTLDALTFYQSSLRLMYGSSAAPPDFADLEAVKEAGKLWKKLNGSQSGWIAWIDSIHAMPVSIGKIQFDGNKAFSDTELRSALKVNKEHELGTPIRQANIYKENKLEYDIEVNLRGFYQEHGYMRVQLGKPRINLIEGRQDMLPRTQYSIEIPVDAGDQFRVGKLELRNCGILDCAELLPAFGLNKGDVLNFNKIKDAIAKIKKMYTELGFKNFSYVPQYETNALSRTIDMTFDFLPGEPTQ